MSNDQSSPTLTDCTFAGNSATDYGGGMYNYISAPTLTNCTFTGNSASIGGGMDNYSSSPTLTECTFAGNSAGGAGGGMHNFDSISPVLTNCTFAGNSARYGGGIYNDSSSPTLANCTFYDNEAVGGGGMRNRNASSLTLTNCTFYGNLALAGGGINNELSSLELTNCILWGNSPDQILDDGSGPAPSVTYSDIQNYYSGWGNIDADPLFVDPDNGDFHLGPDSPCIDAGNNAAPDLPPYDFEGRSPHNRWRRRWRTHGGHGRGRGIAPRLPAAGPQGALERD